MGDAFTDGGSMREYWEARFRYIDLNSSDIPLIGLTLKVPPQTYFYPPHILTTVALRSPWVYASSTVTPKDMGPLVTSRTYLTVLLIRRGPLPRYQSFDSHLLKICRAWLR